MQTLTLRDRFRLARFTRGLGTEPGPVTLERSRIFILPTTTGLMFAMVLLVMLLGSINYTNNMGYMFSFLLGSMALVSIFHTYRNLAGLRFSMGKATPVFAGERAGFDIRVSNPSPYTHYAIELIVGGEPPVSVDLEPGHEKTVTVYRPTTSRGLQPLGRWKVSSTVPLGLFCAWAHLDLHGNCVVYPRPGPRRPVPQTAVYKPNQSGDKGRGVDDFACFRPYRPGDSPRHLFWKAVAREQPLLVKQFGGDRADELWLDWHDLRDLDTEARLSQLCRWVLDAEQQQLRYGLHLPGLQLEMDRGSEHRHHCLQALAQFRLPPPADD
ncbi:MAG: DUF58 domain-containing protein [Gammaproteobacteria bacterium]|nr:MAG: DUF58 domain-containing protein [Gammaproteobacteria bacterium]